jgi:DNA-binding transcriptional MerR regulator
LDKAPGAFRTISEVADEIDVPQHVLRFWESRFAQIRPMKRGGGRRFYRPEDVDLLRGVRHLLYGEGYTIRGVQRILREQGAPVVQNVWRAGAEPPPPEAEEDRAGDDIAAAAERAEPDLSLFSLPSQRARTGEGQPTERREPTFAPAPPEVTAKPAGVTGEERRKLRAALDELVTCHRLIEAVLAGDESGDRIEANPR